MTEQPETTPESPAEADLAQRIEQARLRSTQLAADTARRAGDFVRDHPVATVAGGIAVGALVAGLLARRKARKPAPVAGAAAQADVTKTGAATDAAAARIARLATIGTDIALRYITRAAKAGKDGAERIEDEIGSHSADAARRMSGLADVALTTLRDAAQTLINRATRK